MKIYKVKDSNGMFWMGKYKKMSKKGKIWLDYNELTEDLMKIKKIPEDWTIVEIFLTPYYYNEYIIPRVRE